MYISVEENIRIEFDRFFEAVKFNGYVIEENLAELLDTLEENIIQEYNGQTNEIYEEGYDDGRDSGFDSGYDEGFSEGKEQGHDDGYQEGHDDGYELGQADALENCNCGEET